MKVSICMITYNHGSYLKKAIENVLNQETNFDFELVVANDSSTDKTDFIINDIIDSHVFGYKVKYIVNNQNIGMMPNFLNALKNCSGEYIALCEGDDYWTDNKKLQKQVTFLDNNRNYSICFHNASIEKDGIITNDTITHESNQTTTIEDLARGNYIHTCTVMYRNNLFQKFPEYFSKSPIGDYFLHLLNSRYGKIYRIDEVMATYRVHNSSYWSSKEQEERTKIWITFLENIKENFTRKIQKIINAQIKSYLPKKISLYKKTKLFIRRILNEKFKKKNFK